MRIVFQDTPNGPAGKLADAELHFTTGTLAGCKLVGFAVWERRGAAGVYNVTVPARQYSVNGERRSFGLLRPIEDTASLDILKAAIIDAYRERVMGRPGPASQPQPDPVLTDADRRSAEAAAWAQAWPGSQAFAPSLAGATVRPLPAPVITVRPAQPAGAIEPAPVMAPDSPLLRADTRAALKSNGRPTAARFEF